MGGPYPAETSLAYCLKKGEIGMGYVRGKYTREYFLKQDRCGNKTGFGAEGASEFFNDARPRSHDKEILDKVDFRKKTVIDFGFGRGEAIKYICEGGAKKVVGVDFSPASLEIASQMLEHYGHRPELHCEDALHFIKNYKSRKTRPLFNIVIMFDFVEHVPRNELRQLLAELRELLAEKAVVVINTPAYKVDNDVIREGLRDEARDDSDKWEETRGMHCNRYTKKSLIAFMEGLGYNHITAKYFSPHFCSALPGAGLRFQKAKKEQFPLKGIFSKERFEQPANLSRQKLIWRKLFSRSAVSMLIPPAFSAARELIVGKKKQPPYQYKPIWHKIKGGILRGKWFYIDTHDGAWQKEIIEGSYDNFFFEYLKGFNLKSKTLIDVGAFVGSHSLAFGELAGPEGKVFAFEPNKFNIARMKKIFARNAELGRRISIVPLVLSDRGGRVKFRFSNQIDNGFSSGGFAQDYAVGNGPHYSDAHFEACWVNSVRLDSLEERLKKKIPAYLVKIDTEGAESKILSAGQKYLKKYKPILLIEIHSPENMVESLKILFGLGYEVEILKKERDGRVFIAAKTNLS